MLAMLIQRGSSSIPSALPLTGYRSSSSETLDAVFSSKSPERGHSLPRRSCFPQDVITGLFWITHQVRCHKRNDQRNMTMIQVKLLASGLYPAKVLAGIACPFGEFHFRDQLGLLPPLLKLCKEVAVGSSRNFLLGDAVPFFGDPSCPSNGSFGVGPISTHSGGPALSLCTAL